jgi:hypothetical protein
MKADEATRMTWGLVTTEVSDKDNSDRNHAAKAAYRHRPGEFLGTTLAAGQPSLGNVHILHGLTTPAKTVEIDYDGDLRLIRGAPTRHPLQTKPNVRDVQGTVVLVTATIRNYPAKGALK